MVFKHNSSKQTVNNEYEMVILLKIKTRIWKKVSTVMVERGQCRNLHVGVPAYQPTEVMSILKDISLELN